MTSQEFEDIFKHFISKQKDILLTKGKDYSSDNDVLSNFKTIADSCNMSPKLVWFIYISKHWDSVKNYISKDRLYSESIQNRLLDIANYCILLSAIIHEETFDGKSKSKT